MALERNEVHKPYVEYNDSHFDRGFVNRVSLFLICILKQLEVRFSCLKVLFSTLSNKNNKELKKQQPQTLKGPV